MDERDIWNILANIPPTKEIFKCTLACDEKIDIHGYREKRQLLY